MSEFAMVPLEKLALILSGGTPKKAEPAYWNGTIPWLTPKDMSHWNGQTEHKVSLKAIGNGTRLAPEGAIFIAVRGMSLHNEIRIIRSDVALTFNQDIKAIVPNKGVDGRFLYYALLAKKTELLNSVEAAGHGTGRLPTDRLQSLAIPSIRPSEQHAIASVLGALDDKIELNRRMNETLEAMARALFKSWFVDFDPVKAKAEGRQPAHMDPATAALFPGRFDDDGKPAGWGDSTVGDEFNLTMGQSPPGHTYNERGEGLPFFQGRRDFDFRYPSNRVFCTHPTRQANPGDALVSVRAPVGDVNMALEKCCVGRGVAALRHKSGSRSYTYYTAHHLGEQFQVHEAGGTVFGAINKKAFETLEVISPNSEVVQAFERIVYPIDQRIENNTLENRTLADLRDTLLPKLMSGKIRVGELEKQIEEVAQ